VCVPWCFLILDAAISIGAAMLIISSFGGIKKSGRDTVK